MPYERKTYDIFISEELRVVLEQIKSESLVADLLLKRRHSKEDLVDDPVNFISISSQDAGRISYLTSERMGQIEPDTYWTSGRRFHVKPGGFVSKVFKNLSAKDIEIFSNLFRAESKKPQFTFQIMKGEDIRKYYYYEYHASDYGSLGVSCMRYESCQKMFNLYVENPDKISMIAMMNASGNVMGRALLWDFDGNKIMDRIYTINDEQLPFYFKKWATENGYLFRSQQNWYNSLQFEKLGGERKLLKLEVNLENFDFRYYPYMDTFKFFNPDTGILSNFRPEGRDHYTLCSSDGSKYDWNYLVYDDYDKVYRHRGETVRLEYLDMTAHPDRCNYSDILDQYILSEHAEWREDIRDYVFGGDKSHLNDDERIQRRLKDIEERESRKKARLSTSQIGTILERVSTSNDTHRLYEEILNQINNNFFRESTTEE
jgi:hypothetical protein